MGPMYMGIRGVIAKSFARIHMANLVNFGLLPLKFADERDYEALAMGDRLVAENVHAGIESGQITIRNLSQDMTFETTIELTERQKTLLIAGGVLPYTRQTGSVA